MRWAALVSTGVLVIGVLAGAVGAPHALGPAPGRPGWGDFFPPWVLFLSGLLLCASAFFSSSETAFYSLHAVRLRSMRSSKHPMERLAARLMDHPGSLLMTILMGNCIVNVLLGVVLGSRLEMTLEAMLPLPSVVNYLLAIAVSATILVLFGEILPKLVAVSQGEKVLAYAAGPIYVVNLLLTPLRSMTMRGMEFLFRVTGFSRVAPAPFMTDREFKVLLSEGEASGLLEEDKRQMIQGILEFSDAMVKEILAPRPDMVALPSVATVGEAVELFREHEYARIPVYEENLDAIVGILYAKDLLEALEEGALEASIRPLLHPAHFVPETMSVADFLRTAQRLRTHLVIVVDEFGGTEGLVTLQDALREVVGDIGEEDEEEGPGYVALGPGLYRLDGRLPLDELASLLKRPVEESEHETVAGFLMDRSEKLLEAGDAIEVSGVRYTIEVMEDKRVSQVRVQAPQEEAGA